MKLTRCYIENFGKLHCFSYLFSEQLNVICYENGWGKSTFACFLKSMFYGLEDRKRTLSENERKRYAPWNHGAFGGWVEFHVKQGHFRVERFFGLKASEDTFRLFDADTGLPSALFTERLGEELFLMDEASFFECSFFSMLNRELLISDCIGTRLSSRMGEQTATRFQKACDSLERQAKVYVKTGDRGSIGTLKNRIYENRIHRQELMERIDQSDALREDLIQTRQILDGLKGDRERYRERLEEKARRAAIRHGQYLIESVHALQEKKEELERYFGQSIMTDDEIEVMEQRLKVFEEQTRIEEQIKALEERIDSEKEKLPKQLYTLLNSNDKDTENQKMLALQSIEETVAACRECEEAVRETEQLMLQLQEMRMPELDVIRGHRKTGIVLAVSSVIGGIVFLVLAVVLLLSESKIGGICLMITALTSFVLTAGSIWSVIGDNKREKRKQTELEERKARINMKYSESMELLQRANIRLNDYGIKSEDDGITLCMEWKLMIHSIAEMKLTLSEYQRKKDNTAMDCEGAVNPIWQELQKSGWMGILQLKQKKAEYEDVCVRWAKAVEEQNTFLRQNPNLVFNEEEKTALAAETDNDEIQRTEWISQLEHQIDSCMIRIRNDERELEELEELNEELLILNDRIEEDNRLLESMNEKYRLLQKTRECLELAQSRFQASYTDHVRERFDEYLAQLYEEESEPINLGGAMKIEMEAYGQKQSFPVFCEGIKEISSFCAKLALADCVFHEEIPFLTMDDPFSGLDENKITKMLSLLEDSSRRYQIVYFVCHPSRKK